MRLAFAGAMTSVLASLLPRRSRDGGPKIIHATVRGSTATAEVRINGGRADLVVHHLPAPRAGRIYEVWLERPNSAPAPTSALFSVTAGGAADVGIPGGLRGVSKILVTEESAGGSRRAYGPGCDRRCPVIRIIARPEGTVGT